MQSLHRTAGRYVSKLSNKIRRKMDSFFSNGDLSAAQGRALHFILAQPPGEELFQKDIEDEYSLRPSSATELLKKMEQSGLIFRQPTDYDARLKKILVTPKAMAYKTQVIKDLTDLESELTRGISSQDMEVFFRVIEKMLENMD